MREVYDLNCIVGISTMITGPWACKAVPCDDSIMMLPSHFQNVFDTLLGRLC